ncbi:L10-interacting MYB domain-containing protein-like [Populus alba x Populus x berolinensis]|nr:L10-interacting MYB domain-containing protein-like [Populus alba x Populus x berolinensis]
MEGETGNQSKQERFRTRWTPSLDRIFADLVVQQIQLGNRPNNVFDKKTWNHIRDEFNKETGSKFNNNQLRKHLDVLRTRFNNVKSAFARNEFALVDPCGVGFDLWEDSFGAQPRPETVKVKDCPIYEQLCKIFTDTSADGKYAQSSHFEGLDKSVGNDIAGRISWPDGGTSRSEDPSSSSKLSKGNSVSSEKAVKNAGERKRKRWSETPSSEQNNRDQELNEAMAEALLEMVSASKWREVAARQDEERFTITNCVEALDEIQKIDQQLYFAALDLFEDPTLRETFLSLKGDDLRLTWLQGKCGRYNHFVG